MLTNVKFIPTRSTAAAAKKAKEDPNSAAICSSIAAKIHSLPIHFEKIEDNLANQTRFFILSDFKNQKSGDDKTSIMAYTDHKPGCLLKLLKSFEENSINLTRIESRPLKQSGFKSLFYIDFEGHIDDEGIQSVLKEYGDKIKWLGSYVKGDKSGV